MNLLMIEMMVWSLITTNFLSKIIMYMFRIIFCILSVHLILLMIKFYQMKYERSEFQSK